MFYRPPEFVVDPIYPFANDKLKRETHIRNLTNLMKDSETPLVMTVSASWGSGKTSFIKMWEAHLRLAEGGGHYCIRFDAWQHDFNKEPILAIMGELGEFLEEHKSQFAKAKSSFHKAAANLPDLFDAISGFLTFASFVNPAAAAPAAAFRVAGKASGKVIKYAKKGHSTLKKQLEDFKKNIQAVIDTITDNGKTPLYFFVDELDRCEPHYAIKLLEALKHFFDLNGIIFVLAIDRERLAGIVEKRYGKGVDDLGYLKRFVDINYTIPEPPYKEFIEYIAFDTLELNTFPIAKDEYKKEFIETCVNLAQSLQLKARDIEKLFLKGHPLLTKNFSIAYIYEKDQIFNNDSIYSYQIWGEHMYTDKKLREALKNFYIIPLSILFISEKEKLYLHNDKIECSQIENKYFEPINKFISASATTKKETLPSWFDNMKSGKIFTTIDALNAITCSIYISKLRKKFIEHIVSSVISYTSINEQDELQEISSEIPNEYFFADFDVSILPQRKPLTQHPFGA